ncbi:hypothetical protein JVU11DRAFT_7803 [Chiua virens]|nr:hypothetical protein JVU11DRAFT_7803 [Chiua virens]
MESLDIVKQALGPRDDSYIEQCLNQSNQWPRIMAYTLFQFLTSTSLDKSSVTWKECLISLVLIVLDIQRARRLLRFAMGNLDKELFKELENEGCDGWDASEYPDWLLIQLQGNFLIHCAQAYIAKEMMSPQPSENTVLWVSMGEGKSSIIIPICAVMLADGQKLVRVIVPSTLMPQMLQILTDRLARLMNKRIYSLSFSRRRYKKFELQKLYQILSECRDNRGIIVMQPEDVLSLKLTCVEAHLLKDKEGKLSLPAAQTCGGGNQLAQWLMKSVSAITVDMIYEADYRDQLTENSYAGEVLERISSNESDEILHPQFQLIYTLGHQQHVKGFPDRWTITQQILRLTGSHISRLLALSLPTIQGDPGPPGSFPYTHVLLDETRKHLVSLIADDMAHGQLSNVSFHYLPEELRNVIIDFMYLKDI